MKRTLLKLTAVCLALTLLFSVTAFAAQEDFKPFANSAFFSFGDYDIHYRVFEAQGAEKGRILMIHGFLSNTITWEPMVDGLTAAGYTCVLADMPTFGYSTKESAQVSPIPREDLAVELMRSIAPLDTWILAGHSMGGGISMNIATAHPEVRGMLLYCPMPTSEIPPLLKGIVTFKAVGAAMDAFASLATAGRLFAVIALAFAAWDIRFALNYDIDKVTGPLSLPGTGTGLTYTTARMQGTDLAAVATLEMPVFLVWGERDTVLPEDVVEQTKAALAGAETYIVRGGGHMVNENRAAELVEQTVRFLDANF